jgi:hypothetical protein
MRIAMFSWIRRSAVIAASGCALWFPATAQQSPDGVAHAREAAVMRLAQTGSGASEPRAAVQPTRPAFKGLYPGMRASDLPDSLTRTTNIGEREGFMGADRVQVQTVGDTVTQIAVIYYGPQSGSMPSVDRKLALADAWRIHAVGNEVPEFALYIAYLQRIEGLIDARNLIAYRLKFPKPEFSRDAPALFHPETRVERVVYVKDRGELAFNYQPIGSRALLGTIAERYRDALAK